MTAWTYYAAFFASDGNESTPELILRHRADEHEALAERLDWNGQWVRSSILVEVARLDSYFDVTPISREQAILLCSDWGSRGLFSQTPDDFPA